MARPVASRVAAAKHYLHGGGQRIPSGLDYQGTQSEVHRPGARNGHGIRSIFWNRPGEDLVDSTGTGCGQRQYGEPSEVESANSTANFSIQSSEVSCSGLPTSRYDDQSALRAAPARPLRHSRSAIASSRSQN